MQQKARAPGPAESAADLGNDVRATVGRLYRRLRSERPDGSLGDKALEVLTWLHKNGPQSLTDLSDHDQVAPASMSQTVNRLTSSGYAVRTRDPSDGRKVLFSAIPVGDKLARDARTKRHAWLDGRLRALNAEDQATIVRACALLNNIAEL